MIMVDPLSRVLSLKGCGYPKHHDHDELTDWYGGPFDPNALDETKIRKRLVRLGPRKTRKPGLDPPPIPRPSADAYRKAFTTSGHRARQ